MKPRKDRLVKKSPRQRVIVIGMDGASPELIAMFKREMPFLTKMMKDGSFARGYPFQPVDTPTNWTTLATGAPPSVHGRVSFNIHIPGAPLDKTRDSFALECLNAEYLWDAAERQGKRCIVINWPGSWPGKLKRGVLIGGDHVFPDAWRIAGASCWIAGNSEGRGAAPLALRPARGWRNMPKSNRSPLESQLGISGGLEYTYDHNGLHVIDARGTGIESFPVYHLLFLSRRARGYDTVIIARKKDARKNIVRLTKGDWSKWQYDTFRVNGRTIEGTFRFKLEQMTGNLSKLKLYCTEARRAWNWMTGVRPSLEKKIAQQCGPYYEGLEHPLGLLEGWFRPETFAEHIKMQCRWMANTAALLTREIADWDLMCVQLHLHDALGHGLLCQLWRDHQACSPKVARVARLLYERQAAAADMLVRDITQLCADEWTTVFVVSDHGMIPNTKGVWVTGALVRAGLVSYKQSADDTVFEIDWSKTKVFMNDNVCLWVNLRGRDPDGIVKPGGQYEAVRDSIIETLKAIRDPESREQVFEHVLRREDAAMFGLGGGERVGDVIFATRPGYFPLMTPSRYNIETGGVLGLSIPPSLMKTLALTGDVFPVRSSIASHTPYTPWAKIGGQSNSAIIIAKGRGIRRGYNRDEPAWLSCLTPTVSELLGINPPAQSSGAVLDDILTV